LFIIFYDSVQNQIFSNSNIEMEKKVQKKIKDDFLPIVDIETENRLKLLPKPIYKYIPRSPISSNSVVGKKSNRKRQGSAQEFIQFIEPSEKELLNRVEYDMDEQGRLNIYIYKRNIYYFILYIYYYYYHS